MDKTVKLLEDTKEKLKKAIGLLYPQVTDWDDTLPAITLRKKYDKYCMNLKSLNSLEVNLTNYTLLHKNISFVNRDVTKYLKSVEKESK